MYGPTTRAQTGKRATRARHQTISDPEHVAAAGLLRRDRIGLVRPSAQTEVEVRALSDYDAALGIDGGVA